MKTDVGVLWLDFEGPMIAKQSVRQIAKIAVHQAAIEMRLRMIVGKLTGLFAVMQRLVELAEQAQRRSKVGMGLRIVRPVKNGLTVTGDGLFIAILLGEGDTQVITILGGRGCEVHSLAKCGFGLSGFAPFEIGQSKIIVRDRHLGMAMQEILENGHRLGLFLQIGQGNSQVVLGAGMRRSVAEEIPQQGLALGPVPLFQATQAAPIDGFRIGRFARQRVVIRHDRDGRTPLLLDADGQRLSYLFQDRRPIPLLLLSEQPHAGVPQSIVAPPLPAPIAGCRQ